MEFYSDIDLHKNELQNAVLHPVSSFPASPVLGQMCWNNGAPYWYNGAEWITWGGGGISSAADSYISMCKISHQTPAFDNGGNPSPTNEGYWPFVRVRSIPVGGDETEFLYVTLETNGAHYPSSNFKYGNITGSDLFGDERIFRYISNTLVPTSLPRTANYREDSENWYKKEREDVFYPKHDDWSSLREYYDGTTIIREYNNPFYWTCPIKGIYNIRVDGYIRDATTWPASGTKPYLGLTYMDVILIEKEDPGTGVRVPIHIEKNIQIDDDRHSAVVLETTDLPPVTVKLATRKVSVDISVAFNVGEKIRFMLPTTPDLWGTVADINCVITREEIISKDSSNPSITIISPNTILLEAGGPILLEDGTYILTEE